MAYLCWWRELTVFASVGLSSAHCVAGIAGPSAWPKARAHSSRKMMPFTFVLRCRTRLENIFPLSLRPRKQGNAATRQILSPQEHASSHASTCYTA